MKVFHPADRDAWLELRKGVVTSTESSTLFGADCCPYMTALEVALVKTGKIDDDFRESERTTWGTRLQDSIARGISEDYGVDVRPMNEFIVCDDLRLGASFDWQITGVNSARCDDQSLRLAFAERGPGILEIKNVDGFIYRNSWIDGEPPVHIEFQLQHQMEVCELAWGVVAPLIGGNQTRPVIRPRYTDVGAAIRAKTAKFWTDLDAGIYPPAEMPTDADTLRRLYNYAEPGKLLDIREDAESYALCRKYVRAGKIMKKLKDVQDVARARLLERIGDAEKVLVAGHSISAGMIGPAEISYTRAGYRDFRIFPKKATKEGKK